MYSIQICFQVNAHTKSFQGLCLASTCKVNKKTECVKTQGATVAFCQLAYCLHLYILIIVNYLWVNLRYSIQKKI